MGFSFLVKLADQVIGNPQETSLENRVYNVGCLIAVVSAAIATIGNLSMGLSPMLILATSLAVCLFSIFYFLSRIRRRQHTWPMLLSALLVLSLGWFFNQGSDGPIIFGYFMTSTGFLMICRNRDYLPALVMIYINLILLYLMEFQFPSLVPPYPSQAVRNMDIPTSVGFTLISCNLFVIAIKKAYGQERLEAATQTRLKEALRESEKKFRVLFNSLNDSIFVHPWQESGFANFIEVNDVACRRYGYSRDEFLERSAWDITEPEESRRHAGKALRTSLKNLGSLVFQTVHIDRSGAPFPVEISSSVVDLGNQPLIIAVVRDISDRKKAQEALRQSERRFRELIEGVSVISIQGYDEKRRVTFWNRASEKLYGYSEKEALGRPLEELIIPPDMVDTVITLHQNWINGGEPIPAGELTLLDKEGNDVPVFSSHVMTETLEGKEMFCIDVDLKPLKQSEAAKQQLQDQLQQARKMESIGTLAGGIAHDFNNILQAISGYAEFAMIDKAPGDPDLANLNEIIKAADRAKKLIQQLLLFSRKADTQKRPLNINHEIRLGKTILEKTIPKMIDIQLDLSKGLWNVSVDPVQIEQVILNLGSNAADAMPDGGKIRIETQNTVLDKDFAASHPEAAIGDHVLLRFSDTGHGMDARTLEKSFEPFFTTKPQGKGTGLGLASVYGIVKSHDGYITCSSEPGRGTVFSIFLPALKQDPVQSIEPDEALSGGHETLLVVDDETSVLSIAEAILNRFGYRVLTAGSGEEAIEVFSREESAIALTILDINMPGMGGLQCLKRLLNRSPSATVVMASGYSDHDQRLCLEMGAAGFLVKPYRLTSLVKEIRRLIDTKTLISNDQHTGNIMPE